MPRGEKGYIETTIEEWVRREVAYPDRKTRGRCTKVILRHLNVKREDQGDVASFQVKLEDGAENEIAPLLTQVADAAQADADDLKAGVQMYAVYAYFELDRTYVPRKVFRVSTSDVEMERDVKPSEPPTPEGLASQTMRHLEAVMRVQTVTMSQMFNTQQRQLERLADQNDKFMESQVDLMVLVQDTLDNAHGRRLKEKEAETSLAMKESALASLAPLLPVIINRIAGAQILPEENKSLMLMAGLLENLSEDQQRQLLGTLNDSQRAALAEIMCVYEQHKDKYLEGQKKLLQKIKPGAANQTPLASPQAGDLGAPSSPLPQTIALSERVKLPNDGPTDPVLKQLEADGSSFTNKFRDLLGLPATKEKKEEPR